jgi:anti-sigma B factor antagonist
MNAFTATREDHPEGITRITMIGYLDAHTAPDLERTMQSAVSEGNVRLVVDFSGLEYISSAGLGVFMVFIESVRSAGGDIKLAAMTERVFTVFDLLGFPVLFNIYPTVADATAAFPAQA